jgi:phosphate acyltransferase
MGGDAAPLMVLAGAKLARERFPSLKFLVFGDRAAIEPILRSMPGLAEAVTLRHTSEVVAAETKPSLALRRRDTSMRQAIEAVRAGEAAGCVSAGNTGALMGLAMLVLGTITGIRRPAIVSYFPTRRGGEAAMLDLGANSQCDAETLQQFALMGDVFVRTLLNIPHPTIGLLNIGSEAAKGPEVLRQAAARIKDSALGDRFHGFVEGDDIGAGTVDVVVTDGFTGNVALKTAEGTAKLMSGFLEEAFKSSPLARLGYLLARRSLAKLKLRTDPRRYNGAMLIGLNGIVVKSHGGTDALGFASAIGVAHDLVRHRFNERIASEVASLSGPTRPDAPVAASGGASGR